MKTDKEKKRKTRNKKIFLNELKGSLKEIKEAEAYASESGLRYRKAFDVVKKNGGARPGAGAPKKAVVATNRSVKLTEDDYQKIIKKYGTFTNGVKTLLKDSKSATRL
jgi:uncharacterized membrane protein